MAEEQGHTGSPREDLPLTEDYCGLITELRAGLSGELAEEEAPGSPDQAGKCGPNLLRMLKAAESRRASQGQDGDGDEASGAGQLVTEARKTDMVSKDTDKPHESDPTGSVDLHMLRLLMILAAMERPPSMFDTKTQIYTSNSVCRSGGVQLYM